MGGVQRLRGPIDAVSSRATLIAAYGLLVASIIVCIDVTLRKVWTRSILGADEISGYAMAVATSWGAAYAFFRGSHIRVDVVYRLFPLKVRAWLDVAAVLALAVLSSLLAFYGGMQFAEALAYNSAANTPLRTPLWIPLSIWAAGLLFFALGTVVTLAEMLAAIWRGDHHHVTGITGIKVGDSGKIS